MTARMDVCRLCLRSLDGQQFVCLFDSGLALPSKIETFCRLKICDGDELPRFVCAGCASAVEAAVAFKSRCETSDAYLRSRIRFVEDCFDEDCEVKCEPNPLEFDDEPPPAPTKKPTGSNAKLCPFCGEAFFKTAPFEEHLRTHREAPFECALCDRSFVSRKHLVGHIRNHYESTQCEICGVVLKNLDVVMKHVKYVHKRDRPVKCDLCGAVFYRLQSLKTHKKSHGGVKEFECDVCDQKFTSRLGKVCHMRTHTGEKPYECKHCGAKFSVSRTLSDHVKLHTGETPYRCPVCDKGFIQLSNLKSHFRNNHKGVEFNYKNRRNAVSVPVSFGTKTIPPK